MKTSRCSKSSRPLTFLRAGLGYGLLALAVLTITAALPIGAEAAPNSCSAQFEVNSSLSTPTHPNVGDTIGLDLTIGVLSIQNGTNMAVNHARFDLACLAAGDLATCATTQADTGAGAGGPPISYDGDATIQTTCAGVTWTSNNPSGGTSPNQLVFTPSPAPLVLNQNTNCHITFTATVKNYSANVDPTEIKQLGGFIATSTTSGDVVCNNGLAVSQSGTKSFNMCPVCNAANECNTAACDNTTGHCVQTPKAPSTACTDTDGNNCTTAGCETIGGVGQCVQTHAGITTCTPINECNTASCNAQGQCIQTPKAPSTACTDTDGNNCTIAGCETVGGVGQCVQAHQTVSCTPANECNTAACDATHTCVQTPKATSTACTDTDGNNCTTAGCETVGGIGQCVQTHNVVTCTPVNECNTAACDATHTCIQTPKAPSTACTDTDGDNCTIAGCETDANGVGQCVQKHATAQCAVSWCSPGFWKTHNFNEGGITGNTLFKNTCVSGTCFENAFPGLTLHQVLALSGGCLNALGRAAVSELLNAGKFSPFGFTQLQVIQMFNAVFPAATCDPYYKLAKQFTQSENCPL